ncbi:hypothetical protein [Streptomyces sp. NPDC048825]|uniref:hypothetical protein n=1 Tax=Streptomyces sp. NPDC048825 TaxID=3365592 RepID=UPI003714B353
MSGLPEAPTARRATALFTRHRDGLTSEEGLHLKQLLDRRPELAGTVAHVREFAEIMDQLDDGWLGEGDGTRGAAKPTPSAPRPSGHCGHRGR